MCGCFFVYRNFNIASSVVSTFKLHVGLGLTGH